MSKSRSVLLFLLVLPVLGLNARAEEICGTNEQNQIFCTGIEQLEHGAWDHLPGELKQVVVSKGELWGVNTAGEIYYAHDSMHPNWERLQGNAKEISAGNMFVCVVTNNDDIWCSPRDYVASHPNTPGWRKAPHGAKLKFISVN